jgi:fatty-acyl-CoA synthase
VYPGDWQQLDADRPAVVMTSSGAVRTWHELNVRSVQLANLWRSRGLKEGDHVALLMDNVLEFPEVCWAAERSGLYYTPINSHLKSEEVAYIVNNSRSRSLVCSENLASTALAALSSTPLVESVFCVGAPVDGCEMYEEALITQSPEPNFTEIAGQTMLYSSGTTGIPKGVWRPLSGRHPAEVTGIGLAMQFIWGGDPAMRYLSPAPLYHSAPMSFLLATHRLGGTVYVMERFEATAALRALEEFSITHSQWVPTMMSRMVALPAHVRESFDLSNHQYAIHGASPCPVPLKRKMIDWWGPIIWEYYAGTEGPGSTLISTPEWLDHPGSVGRATSGQLHILDDDGAEQPPGISGTVYFESASSANYQYFGDEEKTASARTNEGWSTMGDIGHLDEDGFLYLTDRKAFTIISGGVNVYPQEAENVLAGHPDVNDVAVFGIPDDDLGEVVHAVVQLAPGVTADLATTQALIAFCREHLASIKCPRDISIIDEMPRLATGKLSKSQLRDDFLRSRLS